MDRAYVIEVVMFTRLQKSGAGAGQGAGAPGRLAILQAGEIVETGRTGEVFGNPAHPYTQRLIGAVGAGCG